MKYLFLLLFLNLFFCTRTHHQEQPLYNIQKAAKGDKAMVASAHPLATAAGLAILKKGGNAADAAVAMQLVLAVVYPRAGNIGGGGFLVYHDTQGNVTTLDYRERAPAGAQRDMYLDQNGEVNESASKFDLPAVAIPGSVAGMYETSRKHGQLKWIELVEPAIRFASEGFRITKAEADRLNIYSADFEKYNDAIPFLKEEPWKEGDVLVQEKLAETLKLIAQKGAPGFYEGEHADKLEAFSTSRKGLITVSDLHDYRPLWRKPMSFNWRNITVHTMGLPASGGIILQQCLLMLDDHIVDSLGYRHPNNVHVTIEAERRAFEDRATFLGDTDYVHIPVDSILSKPYLTKRFSDFDSNKATESIAPDTGTIKMKEKFETTHISVVDEMGNAASVTTTLNGNYGCKVWFPDGGYFLNNQMDDFSAKPGSANFFGLIGSEANAIEPGKRMLSSMTPVIIEKDDQLWLLAGSPGGSTIPTTILQIILNLLVYEMEFNEGIQASRYHHQWLPDEVLYESDAFSPELIHQLTAKGHLLNPIQVIGCVEAIMVTDSLMYGAADRRSDDHTAGY